MIKNEQIQDLEEIFDPLLTPEFLGGLNSFGLRIDL